MVMSMSKGGMKYVPKEFLIELNNTKSMYSIDKEAEAIRKMLEDLRIGRELRMAFKRR